MKLRIYSDGASRGNPGPSAVAFIILNEHDVILMRNAKYVGIGTNNQAEYKALIAALESALELGARTADCYIDSELLVKQLNGEYRIKRQKLRALQLKVLKLKEKFCTICFNFVPRSHKRIKEADQLANYVLDKISKRL